MKTQQIKKYAVTAAIVVAICAVFALLYFGLSQLIRFDKGMVVAEYDGIEIYESDVADIVNYQLILQTNETTTEEELQTIMSQAVETYVNYIVLEKDLASKGYKLDRSEYKKGLKEAKAEMAAVYGSYKDWCEMYHVSNDFFEEEYRRYEITALYYEYAGAEGLVKVTEEDAKNYYMTHALDKYALPAGYYWESAIRPVLDYTDAAELAAAKAETEAYIAKIQNGTMTFDEVAAELKKNYTYEKGYSGANFAGEDFTSMDAMITIPDQETLDYMIGEFGKHYEDRDLNAAKNSEQYANYMNYIANIFKANVYYALQHMENGEVYGMALESFAGYYIIRLNSIEMKSDFVPFENVEEEIVAAVHAEKLETSFRDYTQEIIKKYNVIYYV
jgi:hypothetical protein